MDKLQFFNIYFSENRSRNATVRVHTDGHTYTRTHTQTQIGFIICPMLYAIAMGQIIISVVTGNEATCRFHVVYIRVIESILG